jgi:hypothetical protein
MTAGNTCFLLGVLEILVPFRKLVLGETPLIPTVYFTYPSGHKK